MNQIQSSLLLNRLNSGFYSIVEPQKSKTKPKTVLYSYEAESLLEVDQSFQIGLERLVSGDLEIQNSKSFATSYGGHKSKKWKGRLGDGRVISLGDVGDKIGGRYEVQLKGCGNTPYSDGDGRLTYWSALREFLCSEAIAHLKIPTTRSVSMINTNEIIFRKYFDSDFIRNEPAAIICRIAPSFLRFGHFELLTKSKEIQALRNLVDYVIESHNPHIHDSYDAYSLWFNDLCRRTALLVVEWTRVGFIHGALSTDNMSVLGLTLDYGPYGWMDHYDPSYSPGSIDAHTRYYSYQNQYEAVYTSLQYLASALLPIIDESNLSSGLSLYHSTYTKAVRKMFANKLGLCYLNDDSLVDELLNILSVVDTDFTEFFKCLTELPVGRIDYNSIIEHFKPTYYNDMYKMHFYKEQLVKWMIKYNKEVMKEGSSIEEHKMLMEKSNPKFILRNHLVEEALVDNSIRKIKLLFDAIKEPYSNRFEAELKSNFRSTHNSVRNPIISCCG